jgi:hypothetical protein
MGFDNRGFILNFKNINAENTSIFTNGFESLSLNNGNIKNIEEELRLDSGTELNTFTFSNCKSIDIEKVRATDLTIQDCEGDLDLDFSDFEVASIERASGTIEDSTIKSFIFKPKQPTRISWEGWNVSSLRIINSVFLSPCIPSGSCAVLTGNGIEIIDSNVYAYSINGNNISIINSDLGSLSYFGSMNNKPLFVENLSIQNVNLQFAYGYYYNSNLTLKNVDRLTGKYLQFGDGTPLSLDGNNANYQFEENTIIKSQADFDKGIKK